MGSQNLGTFLRARRAHVAPGSVGLAAGGRRRVAGLRREELALLAGISVEYYQRLEQGRAKRPSTSVLDALAGVLGLDAVERAHLGSLADPGRPTDDTDDDAGPEVRQLLALMDRVPALVVNDRFDVLAANPLATRLFAALAPGNLARALFLDPAARAFYREWDDVAAATVGQLRLAPVPILRTGGWPR